MNLLHQQRKLLFVIVSVIVLFFGVIYWLAVPPSKPESVQTPAPQIQTPGTTVQSNEIWMQQMSQESKLQNKKLEVLESIVEKKLLQGDEPDSHQELAKIRQELEALKSQVAQQNQAQQEAHAHKPRRFYLPMIKHTLNLKQARYKVGQYIPSGTHAKAVLLTAVDASVGVNVSADPQPVVMRLLGDGALPCDRTTRMKRCHIMGAARGDLSSERVFIRLEKLSCVDTENNSIIETDVSGYVSGEDGKNGLAGTIVDRSGRMVSSAVLAGLLSGASSFLQNWASQKATTVPTDKSIQNNVVAADFVRTSGSQGASNAFDKLSEYYIKRAEQLQPVVQVNAGRTVNIVFSRGSKYGVEYQDQSSSTITAPSMG